MRVTIEFDERTIRDINVLKKVITDCLTYLIGDVTFTWAAETDK
jgi:hypothetical protein